MVSDRPVNATSWPPYSLENPEDVSDKSYDSLPRNVAYIENLKLDPELQPKKYELAGTHPESKILFTNVKILDSTGKKPYDGQVLIEG